MTTVENGLKIVNVDNSQLDKLKKEPNAFDNGAEKVLESLELFIDDLEARYYYDSNIPYENMFKALKCVVKSAQESSNIRNAIMTGIIQEVPSEKTKAREEIKSEKQHERKVKLDVEEVREYAKDKTLVEIAEHFGVSKQRIKNFVNWHNIEYAFGTCGRKALYSLDDIKKLAENMTVSEIARFYAVDKRRISMYLKRNGIVCKK